MIMKIETLEIIKIPLTIYQLMFHVIRHIDFMIKSIEWIEISCSNWYSMGLSILWPMAHTIRNRFNMYLGESRKEIEIQYEVYETYWKSFICYGQATVSTIQFQNIYIAKNISIGNVFDRYVGFYYPKENQSPQIFFLFSLVSSFVLLNLRLKKGNLSLWVDCWHSLLLVSSGLTFGLLPKMCII